MVYAAYSRFTMQFIGTTQLESTTMYGASILAGTRELWTRAMNAG